ncbi:MAG: hypothetical protein R3B40_18520 [Polyangiales bacterium]
MRPGTSIRIDDLALAARDLRALDLRMMWCELLEAGTQVASIAPPDTDDAASLTELLAAHLGQTPPRWTAGVAPLDQPLLLVTARTEERRARLARETPEPLRKRGLVAPAGFLTMA